MIKILQKFSQSFQRSTIQQKFCWQQNLAKQEFVLKISNINFQADHQDFIQFLNQHTTVKDYLPFVDKYKRFRGIMFVTLENKEAYEKAKNIKEKFQERELKFEKFMNKEELEKIQIPIEQKYKSAIMARNLPINVDPNSVKKYFESFGPIQHFKFLKFKSTSIIFFKTEADSQKALEKEEHIIESKNLKVSKFNRKPKRHTVPE